MRRALALFVWICAVMWSAACQCGKPPLATVKEAAGTVQRDYETALEVWQTAPIGAELNFGDAIRTAKESTALAVLDDGARLRLEPSTTVRFVRELEHGATTALQVEGGSVSVETVNSPLSLHTDLGPAIVQPGASVRLSHGPNGLQLFVEVGAALLDPGGPNQRDITAGQFVDIAIGEAIVEDTTDAPQNEDNAEAQRVAATKPLVTTVVTGPVTILRDGRSVNLPQGSHELPLGTTMKLKSGAEVRLEQGSRTATLAAPGTYVLGQEGELARAEDGLITLTAQQQDNSLTVPGGWVKALGSAKLSIADVQRQGKTSRVNVRAGKVQVKQGQTTVTLNAGEGAELDGSNVRVQGRGVHYRDMMVQAGGNLALHNAEPPTGIGFGIAEVCEHIGIVEVVAGNKVTQWAAGSNVVNLALPTGAHAYRVRCLSSSGETSDVKKSGRVTIYGDSGAMQLPDTPPSNVVNTDGRTYTVLYQNRLPTVTVQWPSAPTADSYTLSVTSDGKTRKVTSAKPSYRFASGALSEGRHSFQFQTALGRSSRKSVAHIQFDNAAPKAAITAPASGSFAPGSEVDVRGIALPGWDVVVQGQPMVTDNHGRFSGKAVASDRGLLFTFSSPQRGTHHYLRRAKGTSP
jgi:ferric-dicitrate binding protein FerR (iron transport regulator)